MNCSRKLFFIQYENERESEVFDSGFITNFGNHARRSFTIKNR